MAKGAGVLPLVRRPMDLLFVVFFVTHIPTSLLVDGQCALPSEYFPQKATELLAFHLETFKDPLMGTCPGWLQLIIWCELLLQVPFFFAATYAFVRGSKWIRIPAIVYGTHTSTTLMPILGAFWLSNGQKEYPGYNLSFEDKAKLTLLYIPYLIMPFLLVVKMVAREDPFKRYRAGGAKKAKKK